MQFQLNFTVTRIRRSASGVDALGNDVVVDQSDTVPVFGWAPTQPDEPVVARHERVETGLSLFARPGDFVATDAVILPGDATPYEAIGGEQSYENNPWWQPGLVVVRLEKSEG